MVTTDRRPQFQSPLFQEFTQLLGVKRIKTTVYHLCANGIVEKFHRSLKTSILTKLDTANWVDNLFGIPLSLPEQYFVSQQTCIHSFHSGITTADR